MAATRTGGAGDGLRPGTFQGRGPRAGPERRDLQPLNPHALEVLEFEKVRRMLCRWTFSIPGRERAESLSPGLVRDEILLSQERISEWKGLELRGEAPGATELGDLRPLLVRLQRGAAALEASELYRFLPFLDHLERLRSVWPSDPSRRAGLPRLSEILSRLGDFREVRRRLARSVSSTGEILDTASPELARIRQDLFQRRQHATDLLEGLRGRLHDDREDTFVTLREGRYVLSIRSHHRSALPGLLHGRSQSGQSVLVEPLDAVDANNRVAEAREEEKREEARIVQELTAALRGEAEGLADGWDAAGLLDVIRAQARLALELRAEPPFLNEERRLRLVRARHPILAEAEGRGGARVVPLDVEIRGEEPVLLVSGPNMGGKTVALKTVGLLVLMAQAGLHVPAADGTDLPLVDEVFVDLGDEQSIESDLSTFAGHLRNIGRLWQEAGPRSLAILDELGGGTDPEEGAALAMAVLEGLAERGTLAVATTHLSSVKLFASDRAGMRNAAMEFDPVSLQPRFLLRVGEPGTSRAFDIARRILPDAGLLERAERYRTPLLVQMEELFGRVEAERVRVEGERTRLESERRRLEEAVARKEQQAERLRERLRRIKAERTAAAGRLYEEAAGFVRNLKESLEVKAREAHPQVALAQAVQAERELGRKAEEAGRPRRRERPGRRLDPGRVQPGEEAWVARLGAQVRIERVAGARVWVDWAGRRFEVALADLEEIPGREAEEGSGRSQAAARDGSGAGRPGAAAASRSGVGLGGPAARRRGPEGALRPSPGGGVNLPDLSGEPVSRELDLRGCRAEEALEKLDAFLDRARLQNAHQVRIVHGKGTGALKREVEKHLKTHPLVTSFRLGELGEGGWGVTVATLGTGGE